MQKRKARRGAKQAIWPVLKILRDFVPVGGDIGKQAVPARAACQGMAAARVRGRGKKPQRQPILCWLRRKMHLRHEDVIGTEQVAQHGVHLRRGQLLQLPRAEPGQLG